MRSFLASGVIALSMATAATAALPVGAKAPDFVTQGALGGKVTPFSLQRALERGPVVLYFFPAAFTPGCTVEAHQFAEAADDFAKSGATLLGVAADPIDKLMKFSVEECRNKFPVGVATPAMIKSFDVALPLMARSNRTSYVIDQRGRIAYVLSAMSPAGHVQGALGAVRALTHKH